MYKLIIADDENAILEGLHKLINWPEIGFEVVKTFENGVQILNGRWGPYIAYNKANYKILVFHNVFN